MYAVAVTVHLLCATVFIGVVFFEVLLLEGVRGQAPADIAALEDLLLRVSRFATAQGPRLRELDLNPVWVGRDGEGAVPLDALVVLDPAH